VRVSKKGLAIGMLIRVKGTKSVSAHRGTIKDLLDSGDKANENYIEYRHTTKGGVYVAHLNRISLVKPPRIKRDANIIWDDEKGDAA
jgi:hypothetical protein